MSKNVLGNPGALPVCPECGQPIYWLEYSESVNQVWVSGKWVDNDERDIRIRCSECGKVLSWDELKIIGYHVKG